MIDFDRVMKTGPNAHKSVREIFLSKFTKGEKDACWEWSGSMYSNGYGRFTVGHKHYLAHRVSFELWTGEELGNLEGCHVCDNRKCVNPHHLFKGTRQDNMDDAIQKGRMRFLHGEQKPRAKLTNEAVQEIRREYRPDGVTAKRLAQKFGVSTQIIYNVAKGRIWKHVL